MNFTFFSVDKCLETDHWENMIEGVKKTKKFFVENLYII